MKNNKCGSGCGCNRSNCNACCPKKKKPGPACCAATQIQDSFFTNFLAALDACNVGPNDPFATPFAPDVLALIALFLPDVCGPASQFYNLQEVLANRNMFCANTISRQHTLTNITRHSVGPCDLTVVLDTDIVFEFAPGFGITGTQEIKMKFNEQCKISTYVINTFGTFGPIGAPTPGIAAARATAPSVKDPRFVNALRALGAR